MEGFFSSLKIERTVGKTYRNRNEAKADVIDYIERFYNVKQRHETIGYLIPVEPERRAAFAEVGVIQTGGRPAILSARAATKDGRAIVAPSGNVFDVSFGDDGHVKASIRVMTLGPDNPIRVSSQPANGMGY